MLSDFNHEHASQLHRYFHTTPAKIGILTNGIVYRVFSDLEDENKMDSKPFLELNMLDIKEQIIDEIKKFSKGVFVMDDIVNAAS